MQSQIKHDDSDSIIYTLVLIDPWQIRWVDVKDTDARRMLERGVDGRKAGSGRLSEVRHHISDYYTLLLEATRIDYCLWKLRALGHFGRRQERKKQVTVNSYMK